MAKDKENDKDKREKREGDKDKKGKGEKKRICPNCKSSRALDGKYCNQCGARDDPKYRIRADVSHGKDMEQVLVQTYIDDEQVSCGFAWEVEGSDFVFDITWKGDEPNKPKGMKVIEISPDNEKVRRMTLHISGGDADITTIRIPCRFVPSKPDPNKSFMENLLGAD